MDGMIACTNRHVLCRLKGAAVKHRELPTHRSRLTLLPVLALMFALMPAAPASATSGYREIGTSTVLTANHDGQIEIVANNVTLDCAGYVVSWTGEEAWFGIGILERTGVTVRNCEVTGDYGFGIISIFGSNNTVMDSTVHGNDEGIALHQSPGSSAIGNEVYDNTENGIHLSNGSDNVVTGNEVYDNTEDGIILWSADNTTLTDNQARNNGIHGIIVGESAGSTVIGNVAENNANDGILMYEADDSVIAGNTATGNNGAGIRLSSSDNNDVAGNTATDNCTREDWTCGGIQLNATSGSLVDDNTATDNVNVSLDGQAFGIFLAGSANNTVSNNLVARNSHDGIHLGGDSDGNTVVGNTAMGNLRGGIDLHWADNNTLTDNLADDNEADGFAVIESDSNQLTGNTASGNGSGFGLWESDRVRTLGERQQHSDRQPSPQQHGTRVPSS